MNVDIRDITVPGPHGEVPLRLYVPETPNGDALLWIHGGGFMIGDLDMPEAHEASLALAATGLTVASVGYRLAVDGVLFPVPGDDVDAAWRWATEDDALGVPAARWHIGGASAGGNLAAAASLRIRDTGLPVAASMLLIYPVLHDELPKPSAELAARLAELPEEARFPVDRCVELNLNYVGEPELLHHPYAFPAHGDLSGLPSALVLNADVDDLRPSGEAFAADLAAAGVDVTVAHEPGTWHGYLNEFDQPGAARTVDRMSAWIAAHAPAAVPTSPAVA
ncbi:alpha/beta hydrolase fold domain-containing protein [Demequina sp. SYSU T00192]|uniref:Alpha/beta hydrolase fold domain-containing protein n=1 Tax=Demequina litoralis TaxID=3051660 RepID=A0ABT8GCD4_9MICO|nr:alpha/beta hydrolase fold domain-containing protein [Demequina sp. SYSU T00192]MDN4476807.1 alpha/beta hydrolase fold domain-containing protein [Demequina sp. SYSU T00192]